MHESNKNESQCMTNDDCIFTDLVFISTLLRTFNINTLTHVKLDRKNFIPQSECIISNASHQRRNKNPFIDEDELSVDSMSTFEHASLNDITFTDCNSENELKDLFEEPFNTSNVMEAVMGFDPKDEEKLCKFFDPTTNSCFKGNKCKKEHSLIITEGWTKDKDIIKLNSVAEITYPAIGQKIKLIPTFIQTVEKFYAHLCNNQPGPVPPLRTMIIKMNAPEYISKYKLLSRLPGKFNFKIIN